MFPFLEGTTIEPLALPQNFLFLAVIYSDRWVDLLETLRGNHEFLLPASEVFL